MNGTWNDPGEIKWWITVLGMGVAIAVNNAAAAVFLAWLWFTEGAK